MSEYILACKVDLVPSFKYSMPGISNRAERTSEEAAVSRCAVGFPDGVQSGRPSGDPTKSSSISIRQTYTPSPVTSHACKGVALHVSRRGVSPT